MEPWLEQFGRTALARSADTAHDLKTPLNIAVLNLELLRMRVRKLTGDSDDPKLLEYSRAVENEIRRLALIFDAYFVHIVPPHDGGSPALADFIPLMSAQLERVGIAASARAPQANVLGHEERMRELARLLCSGAVNAFGREGLLFSDTIRERTYCAEFVGAIAEAEIEATRLFKLYYTDASGNAELSLATARLISETYGGSLEGCEIDGKVRLRLTLPLGDP